MILERLTAAIGCTPQVRLRSLEEETPGVELSDGSTRLAMQMAAAEPGRWYYADQYSNPANPRAHRATAAEIWEATAGRVTHFVAGLGTAGTCMGTGRGLRERNPAVEVLAVEPAEALHGFEGMRQLATSLVPAIYRAEEVTRTLFIPTDEGWDLAERLLDREGLLAGHSAGANAAAALRVAKELSAAGKTGCVVTVFPDQADRYLPAAKP